jgi:hypothetical protein
MSFWRKTLNLPKPSSRSGQRHEHDVYCPAGYLRERRAAFACLGWTGAGRRCATQCRFAVHDVSRRGAVGLGGCDPVDKRCSPWARSSGRRTHGESYGLCSRPLGAFRRHCPGPGIRAHRLVPRPVGHDPMLLCTARKSGGDRHRFPRYS